MTPVPSVVSRTFQRAVAWLRSPRDVFIVIGSVRNSCLVELGNQAAAVAEFGDAAEATEHVGGAVGGESGPFVEPAGPALSRSTHSVTDRYPVPEVLARTCAISARPVPVDHQAGRTYSA